MITTELSMSSNHFSIPLYLSITHHHIPQHYNIHKNSKTVTITRRVASERVNLTLNSYGSDSQNEREMLHWLGMLLLEKGNKHFCIKWWYVDLFICLFIYLFVCLSVWVILLVCQAVCLSLIDLFIAKKKVITELGMLSFCLSTLSVCLFCSVCLSVCRLFVCLSVHLFVRH